MIDTRVRILEAAWDLIVQRGLTAASMAEIARAAGVSRQAVYLHFGSRAGLLAAMARHHDSNSPGLARIVAARDVAPAELVDAYFGAWLDYLPEIFPVARLLSAAEVADPEAVLAWSDRMEELRGGIFSVVRRLQQAGLLAEGWSVADAADWAWSQTHVDVWRHLVVERGWPPERARAQILAGLRSSLLQEAELHSGTDPD